MCSMQGIARRKVNTSNVVVAIYFHLMVTKSLLLDLHTKMALVEHLGEYRKLGRIP